MVLFLLSLYCIENSVDIKEVSIVAYLSVEFRRNLVTDGCTSQSADYPLHEQGDG